jgi:hypothetical protein
VSWLPGSSTSVGVSGPLGRSSGVSSGSASAGSDGSPEADVGCSCGDSFGRAHTRSGELGLSVSLPAGSGGAASAASPRSPSGGTESLLALAGSVFASADAGPAGGDPSNPQPPPTGAAGGSRVQRGRGGAGTQRETPKGVLGLGLLLVTAHLVGVWLRPADSVHVGTVAAVCTCSVLSDVVSSVGSVDIVFGAIDMVC